MKNKFQSEKAWRPSEIYKLVSKISNINKRNILRGYIAKSHITHYEAEVIRKSNSLHDSLIVGALLKGPHGLLDEQTKKKTSSDLLKMNSFPSLDWKNEVCYTAGYINSVSKTAAEVLSTIKNLARLETLDSEYALNLLLSLAEKHGASNYLSYKLAYLRSSRTLPDSLWASVVLLPHMGLVNAAVTAGLCIDRFKPSVVGMSGICGGFKDRAHLGQLFVSSMAYEYQSGKWASDGFRHEPYQVPTDHVTLTELKSLINTNGLLSELEAGFNGGKRPPEQHKPETGVFTSGSAVIADKKLMSQITEIHRKVKGFEVQWYENVR